MKEDVKKVQQGGDLPLVIENSHDEENVEGQLGEKLQEVPLNTDNVIDDVVKVNVKFVVDDMVNVKDTVGSDAGHAILETYIEFGQIVRDVSILEFSIDPIGEKSCSLQCCRFRGGKRCWDAQ